MCIHIHVYLFLIILHYFQCILGAILFTFVLYNGFFGRAGKPSEWILPFTAEATGQKNELWYVYKDNIHLHKYVCVYVTHFCI